jgi:hypothetical protein
MILLSLLLLANTIQPQEASLPYKQPQLAAGHGMVAMTFGAGTEIYFAPSTDGGKSFAKPVKVAQFPALALGRHRGPRLAILKEALVIAAVVGSGKQAGSLATFRSTNQGLSWQRGADINDVPDSAREGLHAIASGPDGSLVATWLDLRTQGMKLYGARSTDGGLSWSKNVEVYASPSGSVCNCCHPSLSIDDNKRIWVLWRNALDGYRDMYVTYSDDGTHFSPAAKQGKRSWKLEACPMDGGSFTVSDNRVSSAWRRESSIYLVQAGRAEQLLGPGKDVAMASTPRGHSVAWTRENHIVALSPGAKEALILGSGAFVSLLALPNGQVLAAWESSGAIESRLLP